MMMEDRFLKRLRKKARKGLRGWPMATIAFYGPNLSQATKVAVGIMPSENAEVKELRDWKVDLRCGSFLTDPAILAYRIDVRFDPKATKMLRRREVTQSATNGQGALQ